MKIAMVTMNVKKGDREWSIARSEGRYPIHWGMGFGRMGHEVDIINWQWDSPKSVYKNTRTSPRTGIMYDIGFYTCGITSDAEHTKTIFVGIHHQNSTEFATLDGEKLFVTPFRSTQKEYKDKGVESTYLPPLFPMPSIQDDFSPPSFKNTGQLNVFVNAGAWGEIGSSAASMKIIIDVLSKMNVKFTILGQNIKEMPSNTIHLYAPIDYKEVINQIYRNDIILTYQLALGASMQHDIASLGKLMIPVGSNEPNVNEVRVQMSPDEIEEVVNKMLDDPIAVIEHQQLAVSDSRFPNWEKHAKIMLDKMGM